ncbi:MAG: hypothetical protein J5791_05825 [Fibrobacter sp.]|nr:hypothetical protein [Fibrobacter sp.]
MQWKVVAETKPVDLMATILGKRPLAEEALKYLGICREIPDPEDVVIALDVSLAVAKKIVAAAVLSTKFVFGTGRLPISDPERVAWLLSDLKAEPVENHPGGHLRFTKDDFEFAKGLAVTGRLLNIRFLDSVLITRRGFASMRRKFPEIFDLAAKMDIMTKLAG